MILKRVREKDHIRFDNCDGTGSKTYNIKCKSARIVALHSCVLLHTATKNIVFNPSFLLFSCSVSLLCLPCLSFTKIIHLNSLLLFHGAGTITGLSSLLSIPTAERIFREVLTFLLLLRCAFGKTFGYHLPANAPHKQLFCGLELLKGTQERPWMVLQSVQMLNYFESYPGKYFTQ